MFNEIDGKIVASCVCVIIPNLSRNVRPYAFVENVVTHGEYRKKGYATDCLNFAKKIAEENHCYKMMLLTGSKEESTLNFYQMPVITVLTRLHLYSGLICKIRSKIMKK